MFKIYCFLYIDKNTHAKFAFYARKVEFADLLADRVSKLGIYNLRRAKIRFMRVVETDIPPYELEMEQLATIEGWEKHIIS